MEQKIAVITGASSGIGYALRKSLIGRGYFCVCVSRSAPEEDEFSPQTDFFSCDLSSSAQVQSTAAAIADKYPRVDLVVNNAGLGISGATELLPEDKLRYVFEVDYFSVLLFTRALLPVMRRGGKIVCVSSACALFSLPYRNVYCSAKAAVNMLCFGLRMELKRSGINVVCVCPGDVKSNFTKNRLKFTDGGERYGDGVLQAQQKIDTREHKRMPLDRVAEKLAVICQKRKGALYIIGAKYKFFFFLQKILPARLFYAAVGKIFL